VLEKCGIGSEVYVTEWYEWCMRDVVTYCVGSGWYNVLGISKEVCVLVSRSIQARGDLRNI
jgi:hypothetical protein